MKVNCWRCGKEIEYNLEGEQLTYKYKRTYKVKDKEKDILKKM